MAHTDRQPSEEIFADIKQAAELVWLRGHYHPAYEEEKLSEIRRIENYADNWNTIIGMFDENNQIIFHSYLNYIESVEFLISMRPWYSLTIPKNKISIKEKL